MAAQTTRTHTPHFSAAEPRQERSPMAYWQVRMHGALERIEREARRMFQLEAELSQFAQDYYAAVGGVTERLAEVEQRIHNAAVAMPDPVLSALPDVLASRDAHAARRVELKTRYRTLAKEIHPDRAMMNEHGNAKAADMHALNVAYQQGDLAGMLRIEAQMLLAGMIAESTGSHDTAGIEMALREIERAADTYAEGYRAMLNSSINELMLRAMSARLAGWDWMEAVVKKVERTIEQKERAAAEASIAAIGQWRESIVGAA